MSAAQVCRTGEKVTGECSSKTGLYGRKKTSRGNDPWGRMLPASLRTSHPQEVHPKRRRARASELQPGPPASAQGPSHTPMCPHAYEERWGRKHILEERDILVRKLNIKLLDMKQLLTIKNKVTFCGPVPGFLPTGHQRGPLRKTGGIMESGKVCVGSTHLVCTDFGQCYAFKTRSFGLLVKAPLKWQRDYLGGITC